MKLVNFLVVGLAVVLGAVDSAFAAEEVATGGAALSMFGAALGIGFAAIGGAYGQGKVISATVDAIGRNPGAAGQMFLPWILGVVLIESLVIYAFVVALKLVGII